MNSDMTNPMAELVPHAPSHAVMHLDPRTTAVEIADALATESTGREGAEAQVARFCEQAFSDPDSARGGSTALLQAFDDSGLWLANLVHPHQLVAELRQSCAVLTRVIITQWTRQGETHKLTRLGAALIEASPPVRTHEAGQVCALLASLLGILRPARAQGLLEVARPMLRDSIDPHLLREAAKWVRIGQHLETVPAEDRFFWNRRLREPDEGWEWDNTDARAALRRIAPLLAGLPEGDDLAVFERCVPSCWWDLLRDPPSSATEDRPEMRDQQRRQGDALLGLRREQTQAVGTQDAKPAGSRRGLPVPRFALGLLAGAACAVAAGLFINGTKPQVVATEEEPEHVAVAPPPLIATTPPPVTASEAPQPVAPPPMAPPKPPQERRTSRQPQALERQKALAELIREHPALQRLHGVIKSGSLRENETLLQNQMSQPPAQAEALLRWLMLDPPDHEDVRAAVAKLAARTVPPSDLQSVLNLCIYPGSPNAMEARQCARWALELNDEGLAAADRLALEALD